MDSRISGEGCRKASENPEVTGKMVVNHLARESHTGPLGVGCSGIEKESRHLQYGLTTQCAQTHILSTHLENRPARPYL